MTTLYSYDLNGKKLSFANWISNLSPMDVPFTSMTGKESVQQTLFQWQTDALAKAAKNAVKEGDQATEGSMRSTTVKSNVTQILRKVVKVSDTANALANYGRGKELQYQMEKAGKEIKRDLEFAFLNNEGAIQGGTDTARSTAGFHALVASLNQKDEETGAIVHFKTKADNSLTEEDIFNMTYNLYLSGSDADIIMFHPKHASMFSALQEKTSTRMRIFENTPKYSAYVATLVDPLGKEYKLIPNRWMPETKIYFYNASDWTQMVLRSPQRTKLAKDGSYEKWMIEMEVGLRHRNPFASGVLELNADVHASPSTAFIESGSVKFTSGTTEGDDVSNGTPTTPKEVTGKVGEAFTVKGFKPASSITSGRLSVLKDGIEVVGIKIVTSQTPDHSSTPLSVVTSLTKADAGVYSLQIVKQDGTVYMSKGQVLNITDVTVGGNTQPGGRSRKAKAE
ncbi:MAG: SU10 major capsid protein [Bacteroidales bacterium]